MSLCTGITKLAIRQVHVAFKNSKTNNNKLAGSVKALSLVGGCWVEGERGGEKEISNTVERHPCFMIQMTIFCILSPLPPSMLHASLKAQNRLNALGKKQKVIPIF